MQEHMLILFPILRNKNYFNGSLSCTQQQLGRVEPRLETPENPSVLCMSRLNCRHLMLAVCRMSHENTGFKIAEAENHSKLKEAWVATGNSCWTGKELNPGASSTQMSAPTRIEVALDIFQGIMIEVRWSWRVLSRLTLPRVLSRACDRWSWR